MVNDYFIGLEMSALNADKFVLTHIEKKSISEDKDLMDKKFWDYKMWHPLVATMFFAKVFYNIAGQIVEREVGKTEGAQLARKANHFDLRLQSLAMIRAFWKARQAADAIGCTYDVYVRAAISFFRANYKFFISTKKVGKKQLIPYPTQLVSVPIIEQAIKLWTLEKKKRFPIPANEDIPRNTNLWFRPEMEIWLVEEAAKVEFGSYYKEKAIAAGIILGDKNETT